MLIHSVLTSVCLALFVVIDIGLYLVGFHNVYRSICLVTAQMPRTRTGSSKTRAIARSTAAVRTATWLYVRQRKDCLPKSLAAYCLVRLQGVDATFVLGVKRFPFSGHAWVECSGCLIDDTQQKIDNYTVLLRV